MDTPTKYANEALLNEKKPVTDPSARAQATDAHHRCVCNLLAHYLWSSHNKFNYRLSRMPGALQESEEDRLLACGMAWTRVRHLCLKIVRERHLENGNRRRESYASTHKIRHGKYYFIIC